MILSETPKLIQPQEHKAKITIWADLSVSDMDILDEAQTADQIKAELARIFLLDDYRENLKNGVLVDLYYYTIQFARDHKFKKEQTSAFFSLVKQTHEVCIETPFGNIGQTFRYFRELLLCHAVKRPPYSIDLFSPSQVKLISEYVVNTYFRHFKLYKYVFTPQVRLDLSMTYIGMPESPPPSELGVGEGEEEVEAAEEEEVAEEKPKREEHPAVTELKLLMRDHLAAEIKALKVDVESQIKESEDVLNQKLAEIEPPKSGKGAKASAKGKKK